MALTKIGRLIDKGVIKDQTNLGTSAADTDEYLLYDASADTLKSIAASNVTPNETLITGKDEITIGNVSSDDILLIYDTSAGVLKKITKGAFDALQPSFSSVSPSNLLSGDGTGNYTIVVAGTDFDTTATFKLVTDGGTDISLDTVTRDSAIQLTGVVAKNKTNLTNANEPFDIVITNGNGLSTTSANAINIDAQPVWSTASGNVGNIYDSGLTGISITLAASDPESGGDITYTLESGSLPAGLSGSSTSSGYVISGNATAVGSNTTSTFTIRAKDVNSNVTDREFNIIVYAPSITSFTSSGTFSVPSGITAVNVLVVAGGGGIQFTGGGSDFGGGGAGGLIYRPGFPVTPGGTVTVTVGEGGANSSTLPSGSTNPSITTHNTGSYPVNYDTPSTAANGQDSVFGTLTAKGGGGGAGCSGVAGGSSGGSGGGGGTPGSATQPTQPGDSGTYGFGNSGGPSSGNDGSGGGGAGAAGGQYPGPAAGGNGRAYTIADGTTSVYYAGGGGGGGEAHGATSGGQGGGGNGGGACQMGQAGTANRGGGAGGGDNSMAAGSGGKGIVIVTY
jgi:hypothetical protein